MPSWLPAALLLMLSLGTATAAPPRSRGVEVRWEAPPACPDQSAVRAAVERHVGKRLADIRDRKLSIIATVHADASRFSLTVFTVTPEGTQERSLRYAHCGPLAEAAAVLIAMTIDPQVLGRLEPATIELLAQTEQTAEPPPAIEPVAASPPTPSETSALTSEPTTPANDTNAPAPEPPIAAPQPAGPASSITPPTPTPRRVLGPRGLARLAGSLGYGDLPSAGGGLAGALGLRLGRFQLELGAGGWFLRSIKLDQPGSGGATFNLWTLGLRGGAVFPIGRRLEIPAMLGVEAGQIRVRGVQLLNAGDERTPWAAVTASTGLAVVVLPALAVGFGLDLLVPITRPRFTVEGAGEIFRPQPVGLRLNLGLEVRFPPAKNRPRSP